MLGSSGQVGRELRRALAPLGRVMPCTRSEADLEQPHTLREIIAKTRPTVIVNAVAYTAVDKAETEQERAYCVNAEAVSILANEALAREALLIHYSTDYVFDGSKSGFYQESDATNPLSVYGKTKLAGELAIQSSGCRYLIFRTSWVFCNHGNNFARTILRLASERQQLSVVADQIGAPTSAELIADVTAWCLARIPPKLPDATKLSGIYNLAASGEVSWYEFAEFLVAGAIERSVPLKLAPHSIKAISTAEYPTAARRPANSRLDTTRLREVFAVELPHWQYHANRFLDEYARSSKT